MVVILKDSGLGIIDLSCQPCRLLSNEHPPTMKKQPFRSSYFSSMGMGGALQSALIFTVTLGLSFLLRYFGVLGTEKTKSGPCSLRWGAVDVEGHLGPNNVCRYNIQYSKTERWGEPRRVVT